MRQPHNILGHDQPTLKDPFSAKEIKSPIWPLKQQSLTQPCLIGLRKSPHIFCFRKLTTLGYISLIRHKKTLLAKFQLIVLTSWHSTPRLKITKNTEKIIKFQYFLTLTKRKTEIRAETIVKKYLLADAKKFRNQCECFELSIGDKFFLPAQSQQGASIWLCNNAFDFLLSLYFYL